MPALYAVRHVAHPGRHRYHVVQLDSEQAEAWAARGEPGIYSGDKGRRQAYAIMRRLNRSEELSMEREGEES